MACAVAPLTPHIIPRHDRYPKLLDYLNSIVRDDASDPDAADRRALRASIVAGSTSRNLAAAAADVTAGTRIESVGRLGRLRDRLADGLVAAVDDAVETAVSGGDRSGKIAGNCHLCLPGVEAEALLVLLEDRDVYASAASSCSSGAQDPSHVLAAMDVPRSLAAGSLRLSLGWSSSDADIDAALDAVPAAVERLRVFS